MLNLNINNYIGEDLTIEISELDTDNSIVISFNGKISMLDASSILDKYFENLHNEIKKVNIKKVVIDISQLIYLNSNGLKSFIKWFKNISLLPEEKQYALEVIHGESKWQQSTFKTFADILPQIFKKK